MLPWMMQNPISCQLHPEFRKICSAAYGSRAVYRLLHREVPPVALLSGPCTAVNQDIVQAAHQFHYILLSYAEMDPVFDENKDGSAEAFYRMVPGSYSLSLARLSLLRQFNWTRCHLLAKREEPRYATAQTYLMNMLNSAGITATAGFLQKSQGQTSYDRLLKDLLARDAKIIFGEFGEADARELFCEPYLRNWFNDSVVWILNGQHSDDWWRNALPHGCTEEQIGTALRGHFIVEFYSGTDHEGEEDSPELTKFRADHERLCHPPGCRRSPFDIYAYDSVMLIARAIASAFASARSSGIDARLMVDFDDRSAKRLAWMRIMMDELTRVNFTGITGKVKFQGTQRLGVVRIAQFQNQSYVTIAKYDATTTYLSIDVDRISWHGRKVPSDTTLTVVRQVNIAFPLFCCMVVLTSLGIALSLVFLVLNVLFRTHRFIKMSSPNMNNLIIIGSIMTYTSVILLGLDANTVSDTAYYSLCYAKIWVLCCGFTLAFGSMFSKVWRVHSIFTNIKLNKKAIRDYKLFFIVGIMLLIDCVILIVWAVISPLRSNKRPVATQKNSDTNTRIEMVVEYCDSQYGSVFQIVLFGYKGLLLVLGCYLAWETRLVNVPALNDSKYIGMSVYNVVVMCVMGVALTFILQDQVNESFALISVFIVFCTTLTLVLVFGPKVVELYRNPKGAKEKYRNHMMGRKSDAHAHGATARADSSSSLLSQDFQEKLMRAEQDNEIWKQLLEDRCKEFDRVMDELRGYGEVIAIENSSTCWQVSDSALGPEQSSIALTGDEDQDAAVYNLGFDLSRSQTMHSDNTTSDNDKQVLISGKKESPLQAVPPGRIFHGTTKVKPDAKGVPNTARKAHRAKRKHSNRRETLVRMSNSFTTPSLSKASSANPDGLLPLPSTAFPWMDPETVSTEL